MKPRHHAHPARHAALYAVSYGVVAVLWILFSGRFVEQLARSAEELERWETWKGFGFVTLTSILLFISLFRTFRRLAASTDQLLVRQEQLVLAEREALAGLITSSIAHDFSNVSMILRLNADRLSGLSDLPEDAREVVTRLTRSLQRLDELSKRMRQAGRLVIKESPREFDVLEAVEEIVQPLQMRASVRGCTIEVDIPPGLKAVGYRILVHQLLMNLIMNAAEATDGHGRIRVRAYRSTSGTDASHASAFGTDVLHLEIHDNGPGVPPRMRERIFEPFYTSKSYGSGLGLLSVKSCVEIYSGRLIVTDSDLGGALFSVELPDLDEARVARLKPSESLNKLRPTSDFTAYENPSAH